MKLGTEALVLTRHSKTGSMHAALLSRTMHEELGIESLRMPLVDMVRDDAGNLTVDMTRADAKESLDMITKYSRCVRNTSLLVQLFKKLKTKGGTRIIVTGLNMRELEIQEDDIVFKMPVRKHFNYERSLWVYLSHVYGQLGTKNKNPRIYIRGKFIKPIVWENTLHMGAKETFSFNRANMKGLGRITAYMGFKDPLKFQPGKNSNLVPSPDNTPQGVVWLVNGRAVELFTLTKSMRGGHGMKAWAKADIMQAKGVGCRIVCEIPAERSTGLKLMQNKDGFQHNEEYFHLMKKMEDKLKKYGQETMDEWLTVKCKKPGCVHSNFGRPGHFLMNEPPLRVGRAKGLLTEHEKLKWVCPACRGKNHPRKVTIMHRGTFVCPCVKLGNYPPGNSEDETDEDDSDYYEARTSRGKKSAKRKVLGASSRSTRKRKQAANGSGPSNARRVNGKGPRVKRTRESKRNERNGGATDFSSEDEEEQVDGVDANSNGVASGDKDDETMEVDRSQGASQEGGQPREKNIITLENAKGLKDARWEDVRCHDKIYVPFEHYREQTKNMGVLYYLGKVIKVGSEPRDPDRTDQIVLTCEWMNGDETHEVREFENPEWNLKWPSSKRPDGSVKVKEEPNMEALSLADDDLCGKKIVDASKTDEPEFKGKIVRRQIVYVVKARDGTERLYTKDQLLQNVTFAG